MPELPEVETVRQGLLSAMEGQVIGAADVRRQTCAGRFPKTWQTG